MPRLSTPEQDFAMEQHQHIHFAGGENGNIWCLGCAGLGGVWDSPQRSQWDPNGTPGPVAAPVGQQWVWGGGPSHGSHSHRAAPAPQLPFLLQAAEGARESRLKERGEINSGTFFNRLL